MVLINELIYLFGYFWYDWMNKLQLIKGNLSLQKYDCVFEMIEEMVIDVKYELKFLNLKILYLVFDFFMFNWKIYYMMFEYEVFGEIKDLLVYD